jgi:multimeric flavodoxin WrbA
MKAIAINGSPRKGWNTEKLLKEALRGAASVGAETEIVQLYDLNYTGCKSCFGCKIKGSESCHCVLKDELTPVLDKIFEADAVFIGSPIYFGGMTGQMVSFIERLGFPLLSYDDYSKNLYSGTINAAMFYTMNAPEKYYKDSMEQVLINRAAILQRLGGKVEVYAACDTYQFSDYAKFHAGAFSEEHKKKVREEQFPVNMEAAFEIGRRLIEK